MQTALVLKWLLGPWSCAKFRLENIDNPNNMKSSRRKEMGHYVVADPEICHGQLTINGTRVLVKDVLCYVAEGRDWDWICAAFDGKVSREAIAEAVTLAGDALVRGTSKRKAEKRQRAA
jgi:uncharacterized protein (DUF433 family)